VPIQVDLEERRAEIADATVRVAIREGLQAVTIRSVATELGASTTVITNYLPTRTALLVNALQQIEMTWLDELEACLGGDDPQEALRRALRVAVDWDAEVLLRSQFWIAVLAAPNRDAEVERHLVDSTAALRGLFLKLVDRCFQTDEGGRAGATAAADMLLLVAQGAFVSIVETPEEWSRERLMPAADAAVAAILAG
jgi:AcrR family transcriptional regulator